MCNCPTKTGLIQLRVTPDEKRLLADAARRRDLSLSELIRQTAFAAAHKAMAA
jgi:uncharacterized protein (DUF1778 family)